ncbi:hypothetical protein V2J09_011666 [Rumex salicifolius]
MSEAPIPATLRLSSRKLLDNSGSRSNSGSDWEPERDDTKTEKSEREDERETSVVAGEAIGPAKNRRFFRVVEAERRSWSNDGVPAATKEQLREREEMKGWRERRRNGGLQDEPLTWLVDSVDNQQSRSLVFARFRC